MDGEVKALLKSLSNLGVKLSVSDTSQLVVSAPNGVMTSDIADQIKCLKPQLVERLKRTEASREKNFLPQLVPNLEDRFEEFPLNDIQHAYWVGRNSYLQLGGVSTHFYCEFSCPALDLEKLSTAFNRVVAHNDMLRAIISVDGQQRVLEQVPKYSIAELDLTHSSEQDRSATLSKVRSDMSQQVIDCESWPLFDLRAGKLSNSEYRLFFSWDFLVIDAWSMLTLFEQWRRLYDDSSVELIPLSLSFRDYLLAENNLKNGKGYQYSKDYWWRRIDTLPLAPTLPVKSNIEVNRKYQFTRRTFTLASQQWQNLLEKCKANAVTPTNLLLGAFSEVLNSWSKTPHYCLNVTLFNRLPLHAEVMDLVGDFTSLLITEIGAEEHARFIDRVHAIQKQFLADYEHRQVSGVELLREIAKRHSLTQTALMPVVFTSTLMLNSNESKSGQNKGIEQFGEMIYGITQTPQVWLDCQLFELNGQLLINWDAVEELFEPGVLDKMFDVFENLVDALATDDLAWSEAYPLDLGVIKAQEINKQALSSSPMNDAVQLLHSDFANQASATPDNIAIICGSHQLTYAQLYASSYCLAEQLNKMEIGSGNLVAISMNKGWKQVVAVMGILISGAAYLPVDPSWPKKRREHIIEFSGAVAVVTDDLKQSDYLEQSSVVVVEVSDGVAQLPSRELKFGEAAQTDMAYVIFTSGSTGMPKGVVISHQSALNTVLAINQLFEITPQDRIFAISSLSFDLSVYDIFGPLSLGAAIVIPEDHELKDPVHWQRLIQAHQVSVWNSAPQWVTMLLEYNGDEAVDELSSLRLFMMSGDWIKPDIPFRIKAVVEGCQVISLGGATEGAIWSICYPINKPHPECISIPYGKPLPGQTMHVLNKQFHDCPEFVIGDIYIGGLGVAMGYLNDAALTDERFIINPLTQQRLYWTGDIGRYLSDGNIEFLGREDRQVKLHGHRIELDEISSQLKSHPDVDDAVVQIIESNESQSLEAYLITKQPSASPFYDPISLGDSHQPLTLDKFAISCSERQLEDLAYFHDFWHRMETVYLASMLDSLQQITISKNQFLIEDLWLEAGVQEQYLFLCHKWVEILTEHDWIASESDHGICVNPEKAISLTEARGEFEDSFKLDDRINGFYEYIQNCLISQLGLLKGDVFPLELLFPDGDQKYASSIYNTNPASVYHNAQLANILKGLLADRDVSEPLRILEVGAGAGGATASLLAEIPEGDVEYWFTDLSSFFFDQAKQQFDGVDGLKYAVYDIDKEPQSQGFSIHDFDFVVGVNVLHDAKHIENALTHLRQLLKPSGHLLMIEGTSETLWQWVTVCYLEAIGDYTDFRSESQSPVLNLEQWRQQLVKAGYSGNYSYPEDSRAKERESYYLGGALPQHVIVATGPATVYTLNNQEVINFLSDSLPNYMVPQRFVGLTKMPLTTNGKVDFSMLSTMSKHPGSSSQATLVTPDSDTEKVIVAIWQQVLGIEDVGIDNGFFDLGGDSLLLTRVLSQLNELEGIRLDMADLFAYPTVRMLSEYLQNKQNVEVDKVEMEASEKVPTLGGDIAIIGMSGSFPDAESVDVFWQNLETGICSVKPLNEEKLRESGVPQHRLDDSDYVKAGVVLDNMDKFDAAFFEMTPREAQIADPQLRVLLECSVSALEDAGYPNESYGGRTGVFVGTGPSQYFIEHLVGRQELIDALGMMSLVNVNEKDYVATQVSYRLNLTGPSVNVLTACSTSLVAVHQACKSLISGECNIALAGGVSIETNHKGYLFKEGSITSSDGICRAFSEDADGCVRGSGAGLVVLKPLSQALNDRDNIHAVIRGSAVNNDGRNKIGFTAPSVQGQARVISAALSNAKAEPSDIQYVEAHGTGTQLGDPVETKALASVFSNANNADCAIGSLKTNMGHLDAAAGVAGLIKTVCGIKHKKMPPSLHFKAPNPGLDLAGGAIRINSTLTDWPDRLGGRMAGVSSFGVGGTNAHVVLQEAPIISRFDEEAPSGEIVVLTAKNEQSLHAQAEDLLEYVLKNPETSLSDLAYTLQVGRNTYRYRSSWVCNNIESLAHQLSKPLIISDAGNGTKPQLVFMFPGQGSQQLETTSQLYQSQPVFRENLDRCAELLEAFIQHDIRTWVYPEYASAKGLNVSLEDIKQTSYAQPLLFAIEYSLAKYLMSLEIKPDAFIGHSLGEYVAACLGGVFSLEEALSLVAVRGQLMQSLEHGSMLAVRSSVDEFKDTLENSACEIAAVNAPQQCVLSGTSESIDAIAKQLTEQQILNQKLATSHAFHSSMMDPILEVFERCVGQVTLSAPSFRFISNLTGNWVTEEQVTDPSYWVDHLRHAVNFAGGVQKIIENDNTVFLEVGTGATLCGLVRANGVAGHNAISTVGNSQQSTDEYVEILNSIEQLWSHGVAINWRLLYRRKNPARLSLPTSVFVKQSYWIPPLVVQPDHHDIQLASDELLSSGIANNYSSNKLGLERLNLKSEFLAAQNVQQEKMVCLWQTSLGIDAVGIKDNFFELGGDSLQGIELNRKMKEQLQINIPMDKLVQLGTIQNIFNYTEILAGRADIDTLSEEEVDEILSVLSE